jgi:5-formyltetrahydrofolate cyclo-ligase
MQVLDEDLPMTHHDVPLDYVVTPDEIISCPGNLPLPEGIYWEDLDRRKINQIPLLRKLWEARSGREGP